MRRELKYIAILCLILSAYWAVPLVWTQSSASDKKLSYIEESISPLHSSHPSWWVASGGGMLEDGDGWKTFQGKLERENKWRRHYLRSNPLDTDNGYHPQNVFRMFSTEEFSEPLQELNFEITNINLSESPNRNETSGAFLYVRYLNPGNYYYAGLTADGRAVIRKKLNGVFQTLAETKVFDGEYDKEVNPLLIPTGENIGLSFDVKEEENMTRFTLSLSRNGGEWENVAEAVEWNTEETVKSGKVGIRTDFMDVLFANYLVRE